MIDDERLRIKAQAAEIEELKSWKAWNEALGDEW